MATHQQRDDGGLDQDGAKKWRFRIYYVGGLTALKEWSRPTTNRMMRHGFITPFYHLRRLRWQGVVRAGNSQSQYLKPGLCGSGAPTFFLSTLPSFYGDFVLAVIAREQVCGVCAFPVRQLLLIWGGKMNLH